jgi:hypothetical protein
MASHSAHASVLFVIHTSLQSHWMTYVFSFLLYFTVHSVPNDVTTNTWMIGEHMEISTIPASDCSDQNTTVRIASDWLKFESTTFRMQALLPDQSVLCNVYFLELIILRLYCALLCLGSSFSFLILYTVSRTPRMGHQPITIHYLHIGHHNNTHTHIIFKLYLNLEPQFEWAKTVHAIESTATVIGTF